MRVLLIEDTELKSQTVATFVKATLPDADLAIAKSMNAGRKAVAVFQPELIILDMSLPVFDFDTPEAGFSHLSYGGMDVLEQLEQTESKVPVIVLTSFGSFGEGAEAKTIQQLDEELRTEFGNTYRGYVRYSSVSDKWQEELGALIHAVSSGGAQAEGSNG